MQIKEIDKLIWELDNEEDILEYRLSNGLSMWLLLRYSIYSILLRKSIRQFKIVSSRGVNDNGATQRSGGFRYLLNSFSKNPLAVRKNFDCLNICSSLACVQTTKGYKNRISGFLNEMESFQTLNLIKSNAGVYQKRYTGQYCFYDFIFLKETLKQKFLLKGKNAIESGRARAFLTLIKTKLGNELDETGMNAISNLLNNYLLMAEGIEKSVRTLLSQTSPKLVIMEDGNYGNIDTCTITKVAKEMGIKTAEIQHGFFDIGYKYDERLVRHPTFASHKTDYVLTFGDYFDAVISSASKTIAIGNDFLETKMEAINVKRHPGTPIKILFITQRDFTDNVIPVLAEALEHIGNFRLVIRLHPSDIKPNDKYERFFASESIEYSIDDDIYKLICECDFIIGSYSFVMYECIYFEKTPFIHDNDLSRYFVPDNIGIRFKTALELKALLQQSAPRLSEQDKEYFWKPDCKKHFANFFNSEIVDKKQTDSLMISN